jgi:NTE family protein
MREHWTTGYEDTRRIFEKPELLEMPPKGTGITVYDVRRETEQLHHKRA